MIHALAFLLATLGFAVAAAGSFSTANYPVSACCAAFSIACLVWACVEASRCRRGF